MFASKKLLIHTRVNLSKCKDAKCYVKCVRLVDVMEEGKAR